MADFPADPEAASNASCLKVDEFLAITLVQRCAACAEDVLDSIVRRLGFAGCREPSGAGGRLKMMKTRALCVDDDN
jgi:hypothetical protein